MIHVTKSLKNIYDKFKINYPTYLIQSKIFKQQMLNMYLISEVLSLLYRRKM